MQEQMRAVRWVLLLVLTALAGACASPITHPVSLAYTGHAGPTAPRPVTVGLQPFQDRRAVDDRFLIGYRQVGRGDWERYVSSPGDIAQSVTRMTAAVIQQKGGVPAESKGWDFSPEQMLEQAGTFDILVGGEIQTLQCNADKRLMHTRMVLEADIVVYVGRVEERTVHRRPVNIRSERVEAAFGPRELARYLNDMLSEALEKGLEGVP